MNTDIYFVKQTSKLTELTWQKFTIYRISTFDKKLIRR